MARLEGDSLVADFLAPTTDPRRHMIRERWTLSDGQIEFALEAATEGREPQRVGGFLALPQLVKTRRPINQAWVARRSQQPALQLALVPVRV